MRAVLALALASLAGCAAADLRPDDGVGDARDARLVLERSRDALGLDLAARPVTVEVTASDVWESWWVRQLTPLSQARQRLRLELEGAVGPGRANMTFLDGARAGESESLVPGEEADTVLALYLGPARSYFLWPFTLPSLGEARRVDVRSFDDRPHDRVWIVADVPTDAEVPADQWLVWIDRETRRPTAIEFTLRELYEGYRGCLRYDDYRLVGDVAFPMRVSVTDAGCGDAFVHRFEVESVSFAPLP